MGRVSTFEEVNEKVKSKLKDRLKKLGPVKTNDAWELCKEELPYSSLCRHFRFIMQNMVKEGKADIVAQGVYFIHKNALCHLK